MRSESLPLPCSVPPLTQRRQVQERVGVRDRRQCLVAWVAAVIKAFGVNTRCQNWSAKPGTISFGPASQQVFDAFGVNTGKQKSTISV